MAITTEADRQSVSAWFKHVATKDQQKELAREFGWSDRTLNQYQRVTASGRDILPKTVIGRESSNLSDRQQRLVETMRALTSNGVPLNDFKRDTVGIDYRTYKSLSSAANEVARMQDRQKIDKKTGENYLNIKGEKVYVDSIRIKRNPDGTYTVVVGFPVEKDEDKQGNPKSGSGRALRIMKKEEDEPEEEEDPERFAEGTDF